jgi:hypothetical protein
MEKKYNHLMYSLSKLEKNILVLTMKFASVMFKDFLIFWFGYNLVKSLIPPLTKLINSLFISGVVPKYFKHELVTPLIKNSKLDTNSVNSYRQISNL